MLEQKGVPRNKCNLLWALVTCMKFFERTQAEQVAVWTSISVGSKKGSSIVTRSEVVLGGAGN